MELRKYQQAPRCWLHRYHRRWWRRRLKGWLRSQPWQADAGGLPW